MKIVIIGAGVAGLSIGWRLAEAGAQTIVLERAQPGRGATWASAGMVAAMTEGEQLPDAERAFICKSMDLWPGFAAAIEEASGLKVGFRKDGTVMVAQGPAEAEAFKARAAAWGLTFLAPDEARAKVPLLAAGIAGALWAPDEAQVDNRALGRALATAFLRAGGNLQVNEAAVRIETLESGTVAVRTPFSVYEADAIVLAAGAWSSQIAGLPADAVPPVRPVKGEMIALKPPAGTALPTPLVWGHETYLVPRGARLLVGATVSEAGYDTTLTNAARDWLLSHAAAVMPDLMNWALDEHWAGLRPGSPDGLPVLGATSLDKVFVASGQYRNGILFAPAIAEVLRNAILERRSPPEIAAFDPRRFLLN